MSLRIMMMLVCGLLVTAPAWGEEVSPETPGHTELTPEQLKFFEGKIRPLLSKHCYSCHGPEKQSGALRLDLKISAIQVGGESGPAIVPGNVEESMLLDAVRYESFEMPPGEQLPEEEIALLHTWVEQGAFWPDDSTAAAAALVSRQGITDEDRNYWAFQPVVDPALPQVKNTAWPKQPLDYFVLEKLEQAQLTPSAPASKIDLLKRVYYGVVGLPPSPQEMRDFLNDNSPDAYEKVVDRLLASPQYGEHMARHWLDLVRYAESDGYRLDAYRPHAWRYRDYVIQAMNEDKPYDQFLKEQLAGDEIAPHDPMVLTATGFLRHGVYEYNQRDIRTHWQDIVNEMTDVTGDVFLGLGMGCARCHNHKFDPILQEDYYGLRAFFTPVFWEDFLPLATPAQIAEYQAKLAIWEEKTKEIREQIEAIEGPVRTNLANFETNRFPEDIQEMIRKPVAERTPEEHQLAELANRFVRRTSSNVKSRLKGDTLKRWEELQLELDKFASLKPASLPAGQTARDVSSEAPATPLSTRRGTKDIEPHFLTVLTDQKPEIVPPETGNSTGRRLALANWLTRPEHPLTARVMANRIWQQHFGKGLAASASDFGTLGDIPTHPELLDWLATRFVENGWSMKQMHRLILLSATYQQSSRAEDNPASYKQAMLIDPQNHLLWKKAGYRLNADQIRDAILISTQELKPRKGGPSIDAGDPFRSIYTKLIRNNQDPFFTAFDAPRGTSSTSERNNTTTPTQALLMMNGSWILKRAEMLAQGVLSENPGKAELEQIVQDLYWQTLRRAPQPAEQQQVSAYIRQFIEQQQANPEQQANSLLNIVEMPNRTGTAIDLTDNANAIRPWSDKSPLDGQTDFTIEAVVYLKSMYANSSVRTIVSQWNNNNGSAGWSLGVTSQASRYRPGNLILQLIGETAKGTTEYEVIPSNIHLSLNNSYYVAVTVSVNDTQETGVKFYVKNLATNDAVETALAPHQVIRNYVNPQTKLVIGGRDSSSPQFWQGMLDDVRISNACLSEGELFLNQESLTTATVADWHFEQSPGLLHDASAAEHHLKLLSQAESHPYREPVTDVAHMLLNSNEFLYVD